MADLSDLNSSISVKITGSSSTGVESNYIGSTVNGDIKSADLLNVDSTQGTLSVTNGVATEVKSGASNLVNRKSVMIQARGNNVVFGFSSGSQPFVLPDGATLTISLGSNLSIWVSKSSGSGSSLVAFAEFS